MRAFVAAAALAAVLAAVAVASATAAGLEAEAALEAQTFGMAEGRPAKCKRGNECPSTCCGGYCCPGVCAKRGPFGRATCGNVRVVHKRPRYYRSCAEIKRRNRGARSGTHIIEPRRGHVWTVHCDMTTLGGGWTALLNPLKFPNPTAPGFIMQSRILSGTESARGTDSMGRHRGWNVITHYNNGNVHSMSTYSWTNVIGARDVLVQATVQGQNDARVIVNKHNVKMIRRRDRWGAYGSVATHARLARFNALPRGRNQWWRTFQSPRNPGYVAKRVLSGKANEVLRVHIRAGRACQPNCQHGTGWNLQRLYVR